MTNQRRTAGWTSSFPIFSTASAADVRSALTDFVQDASPEQDRAWRDSIPWLQREVQALGDVVGDPDRQSTVLEYELPMESRRPDVILLASGDVVVL